MTEPEQPGPHVPSEALGQLTDAALDPLPCGRRPFRYRMAVVKAELARLKALRARHLEMLCRAVQSRA
ncbi:hypothetical protein AB0B07_18790 [Streptomyces sioyaensis]|uniref:hypothetical protein n=1 Tax=Streptomyces sioyaensis TaxID=67364 RepID=UPI0033D9D699